MSKNYERNNSDSENLVANRYKIEKRLSKNNKSGSHIVIDTKNNDEV